MSTPETAMVKDKEGFHVYTAIMHDYPQEGAETPEFTLWLPDYPDNVGWFRVKFPDGREYTVYNLEEIIDEFIDSVGRDDEGNIYNDALEDTNTEANQQIELKNQLYTTLRKNLDEKQAQQVTDLLWGKYKITEPE